MANQKKKKSPLDSSPRNIKQPISSQGMLSVMILLVSVLSLGITMAGAAWFAIDVLTKGLENQVEVFPKILAVGLAYTIGWIVSIFGVRVLGHLTLPFVIKAFAWITLIGICGLQIAIILKLFNQSYSSLKFIIYLLMMGVGLLALIGLHLIVENHNLVPFSFPILAVSLGHLVLIVYHYVFADLEEAKYIYFWSDAAFFLFTSLVGVLMLVHFGLLNGIRRFIDRIFSEEKESKSEKIVHESWWKKVPATLIAFLFALGSFLSLGGILLETSFLISAGLIVFFLVFLIILLR